MNIQKNKIPLLTEKPLVLYGAGRHGRLLVRSLRSLGIEPVAFVDRSPAGKQLEGLPVDTLENTIARYGRDGVVYVPASIIYLSDILGTLRRNGIPDANVFSADISLYYRTGLVRNPKIINDEEMARLREIFMDMIKFVHNTCEKYDIPYYLYGGTLLGAVRHKGFIPWDDDVDLCMLRKDYDRFFEVAKKEDIAGKYNIHVTFDPDSPKTFRNLLSRRNTACWCWGTANERCISIDILPFDNIVNPDGFLPRLQEKLQVFLLSCVSAGRKSEWYKRLLKNIIPRLTFKKMLRGVVTFSNSKPADYVFYFCGVEGFRKARTFPKKWLEERVPLEFEGAMFWAPKDYESMLTAMYGAKYMDLPPVNERVTHAWKSIFFGE